MLQIIHYHILPVFVAKWGLVIGAMVATRGQTATWRCCGHVAVINIIAGACWVRVICETHNNCHEILKRRTAPLWRQIPQKPLCDRATKSRIELRKPRIEKRKGMIQCISCNKHSLSMVRTGHMHDQWFRSVQIWQAISLAGANFPGKVNFHWPHYKFSYSIICTLTSKCWCVFKTFQIWRYKKWS